jgi:hypothetical protein
VSYTDGQVAAVAAAIDKYRGGHDGEVGAALAVVGLSAERVAKEADVRDDMIGSRIAPVPPYVSSPKSLASGEKL